MIACKTTIGFGAPTKAGTAKAHGSPLGAEEIAGARKALGWDSRALRRARRNPRCLAHCRSATPAKQRKDWEKRLAAADATVRGEFERRMRGDLPAGFDAAIADYKQDSSPPTSPQVATRKSSEMALEVINGAVPETIGGSADLTGSNNTKTSQTRPITPDDFSRPLSSITASANTAWPRP